MPYNKLNPRKPVEMYQGLCPGCGETFTRRMSLVRQSIKAGATIIACSKSCATQKGTRKGLKYGERVVKV